MPYSTSVELSWFQTDVTGLITLTLADHPLGAYTDPETNQRQALVGTNAGDSTIWGIELLLKNRMQLGNSQINTELSYAAIDGEFMLPNQGGTINQVRNAPEHLIKLLISAELRDNWYLKLAGTTSGDWLEGNLGDDNNNLKTTSGATHWSLATEYQIHSNFAIDLKINNLTNRHYGGIAAYDSNVDLVQNPQYNRQVFCGIRYSY